MYLRWWLCTVLVLHEDVTERLLQPLVHVSKSHDLLGVGGGEWQKRLFPKRKSFLVACDKQDAVSEGRDDIAVNLQMQIKCQTLDRSGLSYFLRRWNCLTGQSSSKSFWLTSRGTRRNLLFDMNSSIICFFIPLAWRKQKRAKCWMQDWCSYFSAEITVTRKRKRDCFLLPSSSLPLGRTCIMSAGLSVFSLKTSMVGA